MFISNTFFSGWRPRRTIIFANWDGEEQGLIGATEWVEVRVNKIAYVSVNRIAIFHFAVNFSSSVCIQENAKELSDRTVAYVNIDGIVRGVFIERDHGLQLFNHILHALTVICAGKLTFSKPIYYAGNATFDMRCSPMLQGLFKNATKQFPSIVPMEGGTMYDSWLKFTKPSLNPETATDNE